jgi:uncharacterized membrane protein YkvA (DUF1232 family)
MQDRAVMTRILIGFGLSLVIAWIVLAIGLLALRPRGQSIRDLSKVFPRAIRLLRALYRDPELPHSLRWRLRVALIYNLQPFNLIPDFIPVIGFADNAIVIIWALRSTVRAAGADAVDRNWSGSASGLTVVYRAAGLQPPESERGRA